MVSMDGIGDLPQVPISEFKANPAAYLRSGVVVTNHGKPRAAFLPIEGAPSTSKRLDEIKAQLRLLSRMTDPDTASAELAELSATRSANILGRPQ